MKSELAAVVALFTGEISKNTRWILMSFISILPFWTLLLYFVPRYFCSVPLWVFLLTILCINGLLYMLSAIRSFLATLVLDIKRHHIISTISEKEKDESAIINSWFYVMFEVFVLYIFVFYLNSNMTTIRHTIEVFCGIEVLYIVYCSIIMYREIKNIQFTDSILNVEQQEWHNEDTNSGHNE